MGVRDSLRYAAEAVRCAQGSTILDLVANQLTIRTRVWSGGRRGLGTSSDTDLVLPQRYTVKAVSTREIANSGGRYENGAVRVGPITPSYTVGTTSGGYTVAQLNPTVTADGTEIIYILTGDHPGFYQLVEMDSFKRLGFWLGLNRRRDTP